MEDLVLGVRRMVTAIGLALACVCGIMASEAKTPNQIYLCIGQSNL